MTKIDKSVLTFGITIFLKFMLFDILWCIPTTFASLSTVECYTTKLIATFILLIPYAFFRMWKTETLIMFLLDFLLIANLMYFRIKEGARLGFERCIIPKHKSLE